LTVVKLSIVIPAHNEDESIGRTLARLAEALTAERVDYELLVVDDASTDRTARVVDAVARRDSRVKYVRSPNPPGFGFAVRAGLDQFTGDAVAIVMADGSDAPADVVRYLRLLEEGYDCVFGSRFIRGAKVTGYPRAKLLLNRVVNAAIRMLFRHGYNDTTNAFKAYRREVIETIQPLLSNHFNLTVEMPLKAFVRGYTFAVPPISWSGRTHGASKLGLHEMGSRYAFIVLYAFLEHHLSRGDYKRKLDGGRGPQSPDQRAARKGLAGRRQVRA
jgi:dolichol-phosphate mannosyltransferase